MGKPDAIFYSHHPQLGRDWAQTQSRREIMFIVPPKCLVPGNGLVLV